jgi:pimeloyl-ACP methyl ester carboxylesterase
MRRGAKIAIGVGIALVALIAINTVVVDNQTKPAEVTIDGGEILELPGGDVQVYEEGRAAQGATPIVLVHCYACSLHWWDRLAPLLTRKHRVVRIDLLGFGGSEKPSSGYGIPEQAGLVAAALDRLNAQGAVVVGHSMGFSVATALAERATELVDRLVNIDEGPSQDDCSLPFLAGLQYVPALGETLWRITPDFAIEDSYGDAFAPGFEISDGFPNPDQVTEDQAAMTYTSFEAAHDANDAFTEEAPLDDRLRRIPVPVLSIFGTEDQICDPESSQAAYETLPGVRLAEVEGAGHSPNVEKPAETAALIEEFAADAGDDTIPPPPKDIGLGRDGPKRPKPKPNRK